ncbi:MAG: peptidylprolyl isomerase [Cyclobacteriaceae bacterium]
MKNYLLLLFAMANFAMAACAEKDYIVVIHTPHGEMEAILYDETPKHKENFIKLVKSGQYDGTIFHRVINNFMIQAGDINAKPGNKDSVNYTIPAEFDKRFFHHKGALAAARQSDNLNPTQASSGSQFYIVQGMVVPKEQLTIDMPKVNMYFGRLVQEEAYKYIKDTLSNAYRSGGNRLYMQKVIEYIPLLEEKYDMSFKIDYPEERLEVYTSIGGTPHLDDTYTVFGKIINGLEVIDKIAALPTGVGDKPVDDIEITISLKSMEKELWLEKFGTQP